MNEHDENVADAQMRQAVEEAGGRVTPPNRLDEILARVADDAAGQPAANPFRAGKLWAAALLLLGIGTTIMASVWKDGEPGTGGDDASSQQVQAAADQQPGGVDPSASGLISEQDPAKKKQDPVKKADAKQGKPEKQGKSEKQGKADKQGKSGADKTGLPKGTDPADLAVLRSAEAMLEAEKNLRKLMKDGKIAGVDQVLPFKELGGWKYTDGLEGMPKKVKALDGKKVLMLGFMLPIDEVQDIKEFLLVESLWSCCYGEPPDINGIVRCVMPKGKTLDYQFEPLKIVGRLEVEATEMDGYCVDIYQLHIDYVEVIHDARPKGEATEDEIKQIRKEKERRRKKKDGC